MIDPFTNFQVLQEGSQPFLAHYGLILVFVGALLEGETVILLAGVLCHRGAVAFEWAVVAATLGAFTGDQLWFHLGRRYGQGALSRFPKLVKQADKVQPWIKQKADWIAAGSRFVYGTRTVAPVLLGLHGYSPIRFALINSLSASIWATAGVGAGYLVGAGAEQLFGQIKHVEQLLLLIVLVMLVRWWYRYRKSTPTASAGK